MKIKLEDYTDIVNHAQKLERERDDLIASLNFHADLNKELIRERDEAREMGNRTRDNSGAIIASQVVENIMLTQQRDRLAEALQRIVSIYRNPDKGCIPSSSDMYDEALQSLTNNQND